MSDKLEKINKNLSKNLPARKLLLKMILKLKMIMSFLERRIKI